MPPIYLICTVKVCVFDFFRHSLKLLRIQHETSLTNCKALLKLDSVTQVKCCWPKINYFLFEVWHLISLQNVMKVQANDRILNWTRTYRKYLHMLACTTDKGTKVKHFLAESELIVFATKRCLTENLCKYHVYCHR